MPDPRDPADPTPTTPPPATRVTRARTAAAKTSAAKQTSATPATKSPATKAPATKAPAKKAPAKKAPAKKAPAKKAPARKAPAKRTITLRSGEQAPAPQAVPLTPRAAGRRFARAAGEPVQHPTVAERTARGRAGREAVPRSALGVFDPLAGRPDPVSLLEMQAASRVQELVPIRYGRMLTSPFAFYRGAALLMAADLSSQPRTTLVTQLCGDAHLSNFGLFASPERRQVFDINDFDETNPGPFEWDVKRLVTSFEVAAREKGLSDEDRLRVVLTASAAYRISVIRMAAEPNLSVWYDQLDADTLLQSLAAQAPKKDMKRAAANVAKARTRDSMQAFTKLTAVVDGQRRIVSQPPLVVPVSELAVGVDRDQLVGAVREMLREYRETLQSDRRHLLEQFEFVDMARKVVGVGSVGTRCWIVLMQGRDDDDPLFLQVKEAQASVLEAFTGRSQYEHSGERVVAGQRLMQAASDIFLGWERNLGIDGRTHDYYVRQLRDWKGSADIETMGGPQLEVYAKLCGAALAKAHARSGDRVALAAYMGGANAQDKPNAFDRAMAAFAAAYADQNQRDFTRLKQAVDDGEVTAEFGL